MSALFLLPGFTGGLENQQFAAAIYSIAAVIWISDKHQRAFKTSVIRLNRYINDSIEHLSASSPFTPDNGIIGSSTHDIVNKEDACHTVRVENWFSKGTLRQ